MIVARITGNAHLPGKNVYLEHTRKFIRFCFCCFIFGFVFHPQWSIFPLVYVNLNMPYFWGVQDRALLVLLAYEGPVLMVSSGQFQSGVLFPGKTA